MLAYIIVKGFHILFILTMAASLSAELALINGKVQRGTIKRLFVIDGIYGFSSILVLAAGFILWFGVGKDAQYYHNFVFYTKVILVLIIGILSIPPTVFYFKNRKGDMAEEVYIPSHVKRFVIAELVIFALIPFLATTMAQGIGRII